MIGRRAGPIDALDTRCSRTPRTIGDAWSSRHIGRADTGATRCIRLSWSARSHPVSKGGSGASNSGSERGAIESPRCDSGRHRYAAKTATGAQGCDRRTHVRRADSRRETVARHADRPAMLKGCDIAAGNVVVPAIASETVGGYYRATPKTCICGRPGSGSHIGVVVGCIERASAVTVIVGHVSDTVEIFVVPGALITAMIASRIVGAAAADAEQHRPVAAGEADGKSGRIDHIFRGERRPGDRTVVTAERDGCRSPALLRRPRIPAPTVRRMHPGAIVVRSPSPRLLAYPGPSERIDPDPVTVMIRPPTGFRFARNPDMTVVRHIVPTSVVVQFRRGQSDVRRKVAL